MTSGEAFLAMDSLLDAGRTGPRHLMDPRLAAIVHNSVQRLAIADYDLHAWVIMPNHVHMLVTPHTNVSSFLRRLKGYAARQANGILRQSGQPFWQDESYDHLVRSPEEFRRIERYILWNPVNAGLARSPEEFRWSSVFRGAGVHACGGSPDPPSSG
jgi:REP element-mobilizing transposase RayT